MSVMGIPKGAGSSNVADAVCDICGTTKRAACDYERRATGKWEPNEAQVIEKAVKAGWTFVKHSLRCPACSAREREKAAAAKEASMKRQEESVVTELRQPTRDQKREIILLLTACYDVEAGRYRGADTDKTVAETVGGGCMPGWVAQQREDLFGQNGGNEQIEDTAAEIEAWKADIAKRLTEINAAQQDILGKIREASAALQQADKLERQIGAIKAAVGPKVARL